MKKQFGLTILLTILISMFGLKSLATNYYDIMVENEDGVAIYYCYVNDGKELFVASNYHETSSYKDDIVIPEEVTYMGKTRKVTGIRPNAFYQCKLNSITIPQSIRTIQWHAFYNCKISIFNISDIETWCNMTIQDNAFVDYYTNTHYLYVNGVEVKDLIIPNSVTTIPKYAFYGCSHLTSITIPTSVTSIDKYAFAGCSGLTSVSIPHSVTSIGDGAFGGWDLPVVVSQIVEPFMISDDTFNNNTYYNANLYVPVGSIEKYKATKGWNNFKFIEEGSGPGGGGGTPGSQKCEKPTISYKNGKLSFNCETDGATCQYTITDDDIKSGNGHEVQLGVTYKISVYATKAGFEDSDKAMATLCWIDVEPRTEGITNIAQIRANAIMIQSGDGVLNVSGVDDGQIVSVYSVSGQIIGTSKASNNQATIATNLKQGEIAIVKIGEKSVKVVIQ